MNNRNLIIVGMLLLLAGGSWWLAERSTLNGTDYTQIAHTPDYYLEGFTATTMNDKGRPSQRLRAKKMIHYPDDDSTELWEPKLTLYDEERPPWRVKSEMGWVSGDGEVLLLQGEVKIDRSEIPGVRPMHITTRDLRVQPKDNYIETDAEVQSHSGKNRLDAVGMQAWFNKPVRIKLLANVRGYYEVNP